MTDIVCLGEAWGEAEERERTPFVGASGYELTKMLEEAGIRRADCFLTNVFNLRPHGNQIETLCGPKNEALPGYPALVKGKYIRKEFANELERLANEINNIHPSLIIAFGNTAMWATLGRTTISKFRGTTDLSTHTVRGFKVLATYHPAAVLRQWDLRPITIIDLIKAKRESAFPELRRPNRQIWIEPTLEDIYEFRERYIRRASILSVDIETAGNQITCIGFAPSREIAIVIPFFDRRKSSRSYWGDSSCELSAWSIVREILADPRPPKLFQNGMYDIAFLWRAYGIKVLGAEEDTMLLHHALQPEALKGLGFLGSLYTDEGAWKQMRERSTTIKRED
jgi:uracil-DNA glycosylase